MRVRSWASMRGLCQMDGERKSTKMHALAGRCASRAADVRPHPDVAGHGVSAHAHRTAQHPHRSSVENKLSFHGWIKSSV
jgi:hypothetical protein